MGYFSHDEQEKCVCIAALASQRELRIWLKETMVRSIISIADLDKLTYYSSSQTVWIILIEKSNRT